MPTPTKAVRSLVGSLLEGLTTWVIEIVRALGYIGLAGLLLVENLFPPIPSEMILPLAGFLAGQGELSLGWAWVAATVGSMVGALVLYAVGRALGPDRLREFVDRWGKWLFLDAPDLDRAQRWFDNHGAKTVLLCRLVPFLRSVISIPAGLEGMPLWRFILYTLIGSGAWNAALIGAGWWLGGQWEYVEKYAQGFGYVALLGMAGWAGWQFWQHRRHNAERQPRPEAHADERPADPTPSRTS